MSWWLGPEFEKSRPKPPKGQPSKTAKKKQPEEAAHENPNRRFDPDAINGALLLDAVLTFVSRFIAFPHEHAPVAITLWAAHTFRMDAFDNTARLLFTSAQPGSGKSRALEIIELLVLNPVVGFNVTPAYLTRKIAGSSPSCTILYDEIDALFGAGRASEKSEDVRAVLNAGYRRGAKVGRCRLTQDGVETEELPAYAPVALAGLDRNLPDTITSRSIIIGLRRRAPDEHVEPFRRRRVEPEAAQLREGLAAWTQKIDIDRFPILPEGVTDREADVWEALIAVADAAGGEWPSKARQAALFFVGRRAEAYGSLSVRLLNDIKAVFDERSVDGQHSVPHLPTAQIIAALVANEEAPWGDMKGRPLDARRLAAMLRSFDVRSRTIRTAAGSTPKGYRYEDFEDAWSRYL